MKTKHRLFFKYSQNMADLADGCVDLVVTSPPYPMIQMWDDIFALQNPRVREAVNRKDGPRAFELMHQELDRVWDELFRVLKTGGIACINIGDATRTLDGNFALYPNHSRIHTYMQKQGFSPLPSILWRKQTNAPNKFMGSGMMPPGAYVTLEHEYVLILRKGGKKEFKTLDEKKLRRESSFFWEERNVWFSDLWMDLKGVSQNLFDNRARDRSAAFPFELPYRLIAMFSVKGDMVLDPFLGIGTTMYAAMAAGRNSMGYEMDLNLKETIELKTAEIISFSNKRISERLQNHFDFVEGRFQKMGAFKYVNEHYLFPVMTRQETELLINELRASVQTERDTYEVSYSDQPQKDYVGHWKDYVLQQPETLKKKRPA